MVIGFALAHQHQATSASGCYVMHFVSVAFTKERGNLNQERFSDAFVICVDVMLNENCVILEPVIVKVTFNYLRVRLLAIVFSNRVTVVLADLGNLPSGMVSI